MRTLLLSVLIGAVWFGTAQHARAEDPKTVIEKAIKAYGGEEKLAKLKAVRLKVKGTLFVGADLPFVMETIWQAPNQYRLNAELALAGQKLALIQTFDGSIGWASANGAIAPLDGKKLDGVQGLMHLRRLLLLTPLLTDKAFELSAIDDVQVHGKPAFGVKVAAKGQHDVRFYFDQGTGLLVKIGRQVLDDPTMQIVPQEDYLSDYKTIDGLPTATREVWHRSGKKIAELLVAEVKYPAKIDPREFAKPEGAAVASALDNLGAVRTADVIYGRKFGTALTMDVFAPKKGANGAAVVLVVSGGWISDNQAINSAIFAVFLGELVKRGYTVFAVVHGSQPRYTIPEAIADVNRAVRFIRYHAKQYQIDPDRIGITGGSAGGHLSLMLGTAGGAGNPKAADPIERTSSRVQAVACFFPPTDFLNYGGKGKYAFAPDGLLAGLRTAVDVRELDPKTQRLERVTDESRVLEMARQISPITHVKADGPPTLIVHGDADVLVPIQQSEAIMARYKEAGVVAELVVRKGRGHDFSGGAKDMVVIADWFDRHLQKK